MTPTHTPSTNVRYSPLKPIWLERKAVLSKSTSAMGSEDTLSIKPSRKGTNKRGIYGRAVSFALLETSFLIFAYYCLFHPIPLQSRPDDTLGILPSFNVTLTEFKAGIAAISVVWHTLACLLTRDIIALVQSAEFMAQYRRLAGLNSRTSDRVSTLTSGLVDHAVHFIRGSATGAFRLAFLVMLILTVVGPLGSGTVTVATIKATAREQIQVANLTSEVGNSVLAKQRISLIMRLEREQNTTFKYDMSSSLSPDPVLIPWPNIDSSLHEESTLTYESDIIHFRFQCAWTAPSSVRELGGGSVSFAINNMSYFPRNEITYRAAGVYEITALDCVSNNKIPHTPNATILFLNRPTADQDDENFVPKTMSLAGLPNAFRMIGARPVLNDQNDTLYMMGAILRCHTSSSIVPAIVTLAQNSLTARELPGSVKDSRLIGNISPQGASLIVTLLNSAITDWRPSADQMFLGVRRTIPINELMSAVEQEPLTLDRIGENVNLYMQSAGKAFLSGIVETPGGLSTTLLTTDRTAEITFPVAALVSSKPFLVVFTVVIGLAMMLLALLLWTIRHTELNLFNLENLTEILGSKQYCTCRST